MYQYSRVSSVFDSNDLSFNLTIESPIMNVICARGNYSLTVMETSPDNMRNFNLTVPVDNVIQYFTVASLNVMGFDICNNSYSFQISNRN